jgi:hypothetical protein
MPKSNHASCGNWFLVRLMSATTSETIEQFLREVSSAG